MTVQGGGKSAVQSMQSVKGNDGLHASDTIEIDALTHIKLTCKDSYILIEPGKITLTAGGKAFVILDNHVLAQSSDGSHMTLDANAFVQGGKDGAQILLDAHMLAKSKGGATVVLDDNAAMAGAKAKVTGTSESTVSGGAGTVKADAGGVEVTGPAIKLNG